MTLPVRSEEIRTIAIEVFRQHGASAQRESELLESALIDDGRCVAWSYRLGELMAMWLVEVGIIQFYDAEGNMLRTVDLVERSQPRRTAA